MMNYYIAGVDIGGTFTDCVVVSNEGTITLGKALSTPDDFSIGVIDALRDTAGIRPAVKASTRDMDATLIT